MYLYIVFHINSVFIHYFPYFTRRKNKNNLREFEPQNSKKFKNIQAEFKNLVSYKKKKCIHPRGPRGRRNKELKGERYNSALAY